MQLRFGEFFFDSEQRVVLKGTAPVRLSPKAFQLLALLIEKRPKALSKTELYDALWPDTFVEQANLKNLIAEIRAALGEKKNPRFIKTVSRYGYAFADIQAPGGLRLIFGRTVIPLADGEHVIGRSRTASIPIDSLLISRRHALLVINGDSAAIEDLGSKNGTLVNGEKITGVRALEHGDEITLADDIVLELRTSRHADSTATAPRATRQ